MKIDKINHCLKTGISLQKKINCQKEINQFSKEIPTEYKLRKDILNALEKTQYRLETEITMHKSLDARKFQSDEEIEEAFYSAKKLIGVVKYKEDQAWGDFYQKKNNVSEDFSVGLGFWTLLVLFGLFFRFILKNSNVMKRSAQINYLKFLNYKILQSLVEKKMHNERLSLNKTITNKATIISVVNKAKPSLKWFRRDSLNEEIEKLTPEEEIVIEKLDANLDILKKMYKLTISINSKKKTNQALMGYLENVPEIDLSSEESEFELLKKEFESLFSIYIK